MVASTYVCAGAQGRAGQPAAAAPDVPAPPSSSRSREPQQPEEVECRPDARLLTPAGRCAITAARGPVGPALPLRTRGGRSCRGIGACRSAASPDRGGSAPQLALPASYATLECHAMTKRIRAKYKIDRRLGQNIWGRPKSPLNKREIAPRPARRAPRRPSSPTTASSCAPSRSSRATTATSASGSSDGIYKEARRFKGSTSEHLIGLLERRLDAIVYRAKFVPTVFAARQFVSHGHVTVNGRRVNMPSFRCRVGDLVEVKEKGKQMTLLLEAIKSAERDVPDYIEADHNKMTAKLTPRAGPERRAVPGPHGAQPGGRVLLALIRSRFHVMHSEKPEPALRLFSYL